MNRATVTTMILTTAIAASITSCRCSKQSADNATSNQPTFETVTATRPIQSEGTPSTMIPKAVIYKTNGNYNDNVPVTLSADGKSLASYPAVTDITAASTPIVVADSWLLDRRGVSANSVFTSYTYNEYRNLEQTPSPAMLLERIIPGSRVTIMAHLPISINEALNDTAAVNRLIRESDFVRVFDTGIQPLQNK